MKESYYVLRRQYNKLFFELIDQNIVNKNEQIL